MKKILMSYDGLCNKQSKLPFHIDETQSLLYAGQCIYIYIYIYVCHCVCLFVSVACVCMHAADACVGTYAYVCVHLQ